MCQHDLDGERIFQHRNLHKWHLFEENPWVPGFLFEGGMPGISRGFAREVEWVDRRASEPSGGLGGEVGTQAPGDGMAFGNERRGGDRGKANCASGWHGGSGRSVAEAAAAEGSRDAFFAGGTLRALERFEGQLLGFARKARGVAFGLGRERRGAGADGEVEAARGWELEGRIAGREGCVEVAIAGAGRCLPFDKEEQRR